MQTNKINVYSLNYTQSKTYMLALAFVAGNIILPQLCHAIPQGGLRFLPIYFFTLIASYKFGWKVGLLTAVLSPVVNSLCFGMPALSMLPIILTKSLLLAFAASFVAHKSKGHTILSLVAIVAFYQVIGTLIEWAIVKDFGLAIQDFRLGLPGMMLQIFGGYAFLKYIYKK